jgi:hypothetical protein
MRLISTLLFILCLCSAALAQDAPRHFLRLSAGPAFTGSGDRNGVSANATFGLDIKPRLHLLGGYSHSRFDQGVFEFGHATVHSAELGAAFDLISTGFFSLEAGAGACFQWRSAFYKTGPFQSIYVDGGFQLGPNEEGTYKVRQAGYMVSLGAVFHLASWLDLGLWGVFQNGTEGDNTAALRLGGQVRF